MRMGVEELSQPMCTWEQAPFPAELPCEAGGWPGADLLLRQLPASPQLCGDFPEWPGAAY